MNRVYWFRQTMDDVPSSNVWLSENEKKKLDSLRFPKRRADWRLGRWTTKQAVSLCLNLCPSDTQALARLEIRPAGTGAPEVFLNDVPANVSLSISHRDDVCVCAVGPAGVDLGCDVEVIEPHSAEFIIDYLHLSELETLAGAVDCDRVLLVSLIWSAKESALKALKQGLRADVRSVQVHLGQWSTTNAEWNALHVIAESRLFRGWWKTDNKLIYTFAADPSISPPTLIRADDMGEIHAVNR